MGEPPLSLEAVNVTVAWPFPADASISVGALGVANGVTLFEAAEAAPVPTALVAVTVKV
jgi:hypothetical protein